MVCDAKCFFEYLFVYKCCVFAQQCKLLCFLNCVRCFPSYQKQASMHDFCGRVTDDWNTSFCLETNHITCRPMRSSNFLQKSIEQWRLQNLTLAYWPVALNVTMSLSGRVCDVATVYRTVRPKNCCASGCRPPLKIASLTFFIDSITEIFLEQFRCMLWYCWFNCWGYSQCNLVAICCLPTYLLRLMIIVPR